MLPRLRLRSFGARLPWRDASCARRRYARRVAPWLALVPLLSAFAPPLHAADPVALPPVVRTVLPNGLTVLVAANHEVPLVSIHVLVRAGSKDDPPGKEGLADLTATLVRRGAGELDARAFAQAIDATGGSLSTGAGTEYATADAEFLVRDLDSGLQLVADLLTRPRFDSDEVARTLRQAIAARRQVLDDPSALANEQMLQQLFGTHPYGHPSEGLAAALETLTRADVVAFHQRYWAAANTVVALVGDVDPEATTRTIARLFGAWAAGTRNDARPDLPAPVQGRRLVLVAKPGATQAQIRLAQVGIDRYDPDYFAVTLANTVLGGGFTSWLVDEIRVNRGLSYSVSSRIYPLAVGGYQRVATFTKNSTTGETIDVALAQIERLARGEIDSVTLAKAKQYLIGLYPLRLETADAVAGTLADLEYYGQPTSWIENYTQRLEEVTLAQVRAAARTHFGDDNLLFVIVGDPEKVQGQLAKFGPVTVVVPD